MTDSRGQVLQINNATCLHEEDHDILWKHMDWRTNQTEVRRSGRLVVSMIATVDTPKVMLREPYLLRDWPVVGPCRTVGGTGPRRVAGH